MLAPCDKHPQQRLRRASTSWPPTRTGASRASTAACWRPRRPSPGVDVQRPVRQLPRLRHRRPGRAGRAWPRADLIVLLHPIQWYSMPALQKLWLDEVLDLWLGLRHAAARRCRARTCGWSPPPAGPRARYHPQGYNRYFFDAFLPPYEQTAALCGMRFLPPLVLHGARTRQRAGGRRRTSTVFARAAAAPIPTGPSSTNWRNAPACDVPERPTGPAAPRRRRLMEHAPAWLTNSLIYLAAAVIAVPLSRALGPGLHHRLPGRRHRDRPLGPGPGHAMCEDILHFAEFGVVLMLFLVGLELEPRRLWSLRRPIFGWGSAQVLGCAALLFAAGMLRGRRPGASALVAALGPGAVVHRHRAAGDGRAQPAAHLQRPGRLLDPAVPGRGGDPDPGAAAAAGRRRPTPTP